MGFLKEKYTREYFTRRDNNGNATEFGALGADEWRAGGIFHEIQAPLDQISMQGRRVLEIGYGRAESARYLISAQRISQYTGIDFSDAAYQLALETLSPFLSADYKITHGDALEFLSQRSFEAEFDVVLMLDAIEHIPTQEMAVIYPLLFKALSPGGYLIVDTPFYPIDEDYIAQGYDYKIPSVSDLIPETRGMHCNKFTRDRLLYEMSAAGFSVIGDKLFQKPSMMALHIDAEHDLHEFVKELNGQIWTGRKSQLFIPKAQLGDGQIHISFDLTTTARSAYETYPVNGAVFVGGKLLIEAMFEEDMVHPVSFSYVPEGSDLSVDFTSNSRLVVDRPGCNRSFVLSNFFLRTQGSKKKSNNSIPHHRETPSVEFVDVNSEAKISKLMTSGELGVSASPKRVSSGNDAIALVQVDILSADKRHAIIKCRRGDNVVVRCHFKATSRVEGLQCSLTLLSDEGVALVKRSGLLGHDKTFFTGEAALMEFCFEVPQLNDGEYALQIADSHGVLLGQSSLSVGCLRGQQESIQLAQGHVSTLPAWAGAASVAQVTEREGETWIAIHSRTFRVEPHWFWQQFASGWEEDTFRVFQRYIKSDRPYVDVGAWVGPTIIYAAALGAPRIVAVEANPRTVEHLARTVSYNPRLFKTVHLVNRCVHAEAGTFNFGNVDGSDSTSSASSLRGTGFQVDSISLWDLLKSTDTVNASLVKIDIEGAELFIGADLVRLSSQPDVAIHLSLHPPFWGEMGGSTELLGALRGYRLYWPNGEKADISEVIARSTSGDEFPPWGTAYGNFFEIVMLSKGDPT
jgi:FkbM family methyltransferase